jgi:predicted metal-dependent peptidase
MEMDSIYRKVQKAKIDLMRSSRFAMWSGILMMGETSVVDDCPTARTNGRDEEYGREFIRGLDGKEVAFVVMHEGVHKAFRHLTIWKKLYEENPRIANMACDYVNNLMLVEADPREEVIAMPRKDGRPVGLLDTRFRGMDSKQVFNILKNEAQSNEPNGSNETQQGALDEHDWEGANNVSKEEAEALEGEIDRALRQGVASQRHAGTTAGGMSRLITDLLTPEVDWREQLREFVTSTCSSKDTSSWGRVNRRFLSHGVYMPSLTGESVGGMVVGVDTSGSVGGAELTKFLTEINAIAEDVSPEVLDLLYWDSAVAAHEQYDMATLHNIVSSTKPRGGGGTRPGAVQQYIEEKQLQPEVIVMLTDGCVDSWGSNWSAPIVWVVLDSSRSRVAPMGKTIFIKE